MKVNKHLRKLLMRQSETLMLSTTKCMYLGTIYTFPPVTNDEREEMRLSILKLLSPLDYFKEWIRR